MAEDIGVDAVKIGMVGAAETIEAVAEALDLTGDAPVVLDPVMVAESGARLLDEEARRRCARCSCRGPPWSPRTWPRPPSSRATEDGRRRRRWPGPCTRSARGPWWSPAATATQATDVFFDGERLEPIAGERHPDGAAHGSGCTHSSALAAELALGASSRSRPRAGPRRSPRTRCATGCASSARAPARWTCFGLASRQGRAARAWHNRPPVIKFLRMKPGHGEVLLAEGDRALREDEERLVEEFRRQLDEGMWAAVPTTTARQRPARGAAGPGTTATSRGDAERVIFFPRAAGG